MSEETPNLKTKDLLIEICPVCNALHTYRLTDGVLDGIGKNEIPCGTHLGLEPEQRPLAPGEERKSVFCTHIIKPTTENSYTIRRWNFRERQQFYELIGTFSQAPQQPGSVASLKLNISPQVMDFAILHGTVKSPTSLKNKEDLDRADLDGAVLEALYSEVVDYNTPPLSQSSTLRRRFLRTTRNSAPETG